MAGGQNNVKAGKARGGKNTRSKLKRQLAYYLNQNRIFQGELNRNKKGLALDLKQEPGREILGRLVKGADVFMTNYELSTLKKLKLV